MLEARKNSLKGGENMTAAEKRAAKEWQNELKNTHIELEAFLAMLGNLREREAIKQEFARQSDPEVLKQIARNDRNAQKQLTAEERRQQAIDKRKKDREREKELKKRGALRVPQPMVTVDPLTGKIKKTGPAELLGEGAGEEEKPMTLEEHEAAKDNLMGRVFVEFASKKLWRPHEMGSLMYQGSLQDENAQPPLATMDPHAPMCLSEQSVVEVFEFLEVVMTERDIKVLFEQIDADGSGTIEEDEWKAFFDKASHRDGLKKRACLKERYLKQVFMEFDVEDREFLLLPDLQNIVKFLGLKGMSEGTVEQLFSGIDTSGDGKIQLDEFLAFFQEISSEQEMKAQLAQFQRKSGRAIYFYVGYCCLALTALGIGISEGITEMIVIASVVLSIFLGIFIGPKRFGQGCGFLYSTIFDVSETRLRVYCGLSMVLLVGLVVWQQWEIGNDNDTRLNRMQGTVNAKHVEDWYVRFRLVHDFLLLLRTRAKPGTYTVRKLLPHLG